MLDFQMKADKPSPKKAIGIEEIYGVELGSGALCNFNDLEDTEVVVKWIAIDGDCLDISLKGIGELEYIPEPASMVMFGLSIAGMYGAKKRMKKVRKNQTAYTDHYD